MIGKWGRSSKRGEGVRKFEDICSFDYVGLIGSALCIHTIVGNLGKLFNTYFEMMRSFGTLSQLLL